MVKITRYLDENTEQGAGGPPTNPPAPVEGADAAKLVETETAELTSLLEKSEAELSADEKTKLATLKTKYDVAEVKEDGSPLTKEEKEAAEKVGKRLTDIKAKPEAQRTLEEIKFLKDNTEEPLNIYAQVDELSGMPVEVEYGDVAPNSPQGILLREDTIRDQAKEVYDNELKEKHPLAYQMMLHQQAGGNPEDFLRTQAEDYSSIKLTKTDLASQETILRKALALKGIDQESINILVTTAKDKGKLFERSQQELDILQANQADEEANRAAIAKQNLEKERQVSATFFANLDKTFEKGIQGIIIPKGERKAFTDYITEHLGYYNGKLIYTKAIDPTNLVEELAANYFKFKKADLSKLVLNKAKDLNTNKFRNNIKYKVTPKNTSIGNKNFVPLGDL